MIRTETYYDVIIVGSGPAGASLAIALAKLGISVLLADRKEFPRAKACGDLLVPNVFDVTRKLEVEDRFDPRELHGIENVKFFSPNRSSLEVCLDKDESRRFVVARRSYFDEVLRTSAVECGAQFQKISVKKLLAFDGKFTGIESETERYKSRVVVGADGATSVVAREIGFSCPMKRRGIAVRGYGVRGESASLTSAELHFTKKLLPGYGWLFPAGDDLVNVGIGMPVKEYLAHTVKLKYLLDVFVAELNAARKLASPQLSDIESWTLNSAPEGKSRVGDGVVLVGDAGNFVEPFTGAGIHTAMQSAVSAALVIQAALRTGDTSRKFLCRFDTDCRKQFDKDFYLLLAVQHLFARAKIIDSALTYVPNAAAFLLGKLAGRY